MIKRIVQSVSWVLLVVLASAVELQAQQQEPPQEQQQQDEQQTNQTEAERQPEGGVRGLFGAARDQNRGLVLTLSVSEEYTNDLSGGGNEFPVLSLVQEPGYFTGLHADLSYDRHTPRVSLGFRSDGSMRHYTTLHDYTMPRFRSEVDVSARLGRTRRSSLRLSQSVEYSPYYRLALYQPLAVPVLDRVGLDADRDDLLTDRAYYIHGSSLAYTYEFTPRMSVSFDSGLRVTQSGDPAFDVRDLHGSIGLSRRVSPYLALRAGYGYRQGALPSALELRQIESHDFDLGVSYSRPITRSRRTFVSFDTGSALIDDAYQRQYRIVGSASLRHQMPKRWMLDIGYDRGFQLVEGFTEPLLSDGVRASLGGQVNHRLEMATTARYAFGKVGLAGGDFRSAEGSLSLRYALSRYLALDAQYLFYQYDFAEGVQLLALVPPRQNRQAARVTLTLWLPLAR